MKTCFKCKVEKPTDNFSKGKNKDGLHSWCKPCVAKARLITHYKDKEKSNRVNRLRDKAAYRRNQNLMWKYLEDHPCIDCGNSDKRVLEFDHRDPSLKVAAIGVLLKNKHRWEPIKEEIDKCDVRCANCHRIKTYEQLGWRRPI